MSLKEVGIRGIAVPSKLGNSWITGATGFPLIEKNRKNPDVSNLKIAIPGLEYPFSGYFAVASKIGKALQHFADEDKMITVIFEQKKKNKLPEDEANKDITELRDTPEHAKKTTVKTVAGIYDYNKNTWIFTDEASFNGKDIPSDWTNELIQKSQDVNFDLGDLAPTEDIPKPNVPQSVDKQSFLINYYMFVKDMETKYGYELTDERRKLISRKLLKIADGFQQKMTGLPVPNYKDYSHTRARQLVFQVTERFIILDEKVQTDEGLQEIVKGIISYGLNLLAWTE